MTRIDVASRATLRSGTQVGFQEDPLLVLPRQLVPLDHNDRVLEVAFALRTMDVSEAIPWFETAKREVYTARDANPAHCPSMEECRISCEQLIAILDVEELLPPDMDAAPTLVADVWLHALEAAGLLVKISNEIFGGRKIRHRRGAPSGQDGVATSALMREVYGPDNTRRGWNGTWSCPSVKLELAA